MIAAPYYQPGHKTKCFVRATNISSEIITIGRGKKIVRILFEQLADKPEITYSQDKSASLNDGASPLLKKELKKIQ